jgi:ABC-type nitrate/sulfonate/bicarbonate transport system substrate-binding protein
MMFLRNPICSRKSKKLRLAYSGWEIGTAVAYVGVDSGLFKRHDLEIEELPIRDTLSAGVQSLLGVDMLIGFGNPLAILQPVAGGADLSLVGAHVSFDHYGMGVASSISTVKDLKGKKIGVSALGTRSDLVARVILRRAGLDPAKDVEVVAAGLSPARALALSKNLVQGAPLSPDVVEPIPGISIFVSIFMGVAVRISTGPPMPWAGTSKRPQTWRLVAFCIASLPPVASM